MLAVFSATALRQPRQASPERVGEYRQTQPFYRALWKSVNASFVESLFLMRKFRRLPEES